MRPRAAARQDIILVGAAAEGACLAPPEDRA